MGELGVCSVSRMKVVLLNLANAKIPLLLALVLPPLLTSCVPDSIFRACDSRFSAAQLYARTLPSVAVINTGNGLGSGFVVEQKNGKTYLVTNSHVTSGKVFVEVIWADKSREEGRVVADLMGEKETDIALVEVKGVRGNPIKIQESLPAIGSDVVAIGAPRGLDFSMSRGIVSQLRKDNRLIQIDVPINPGNSGGPILTSGGCVAGMVTFKRSDSEGLNFAIAPSVLNRFIKKPVHVRFDDSAVIDQAPPFFFNTREATKSFYDFTSEDEEAAVWSEPYLQRRVYDYIDSYSLSSDKVVEMNGWKNVLVRIKGRTNLVVPYAVQCDEGLIAYPYSMLFRKMGSEWWHQEWADIEEQYEGFINGESKRSGHFANGSLTAEYEKLLAELDKEKYPSVARGYREIMSMFSRHAIEHYQIFNPMFRSVCLNK